MKYDATNDNINSIIYNINLFFDKIIRVMSVTSRKHQSNLFMYTVLNLEKK